VRTPYLGLSNYVRNLRRLGYSEEDVADGGSDQLIDDLVLHGEPQTVVRGLPAHIDGGADHVAVHSISAPLETHRALAAELFRVGLRRCG